MSKKEKKMLIKIPGKEVLKREATSCVWMGYVQVCRRKGKQINPPTLIDKKVAKTPLAWLSRLTRQGSFVQALLYLINKKKHRSTMGFLKANNGSVG